ncbi:hypothetical protein HMPREF1437_00981 [Helicobacter pylori HP116Bi]|nr:hypothetical protein HMPREF1437_00981 [Helicobacter pylori HP116Bi]
MFLKSVRILNFFNFIFHYAIGIFGSAILKLFKNGLFGFTSSF